MISNIAFIPVHWLNEGHILPYKIIKFHVLWDIMIYTPQY